MQLFITYTDGKTESYTVDKVHSPRIHNNGFFYIDLDENESRSVLVINASLIRSMAIVDNVGVNEEDGVLQS